MISTLLQTYTQIGHCFFRCALVALLLSLPPNAIPLYAGTDSAWMVQNAGLPPQISVTTLLAPDLAQRPDLLLAGVYSPKSLYISADGGVTWRVAGDGVDGQPVHMLDHHGERLLAGTSTGLYVSEAFDDEGDPVWQRVDSWPQRRAVYNLAQTPSGESLVAGMWPALLVDDGESIRFTAPVIPEPGALLSVLALDDGTILVGSDGAGLFVSGDGGASWQQAEEIGETFVAALQAAPWNEELVLARTRKGLFRSQDSGRTWSLVALVAEGRPDALLALPDRRRLVVGMSTGQIYASADDGETWTAWGEGLPRDGLFQTLAQVDGSLWAGTAHGLYVSNDAGQSWTQHPDLGAPSLSALTVAGDGILYAGSHDGVYRSTDGGATWSPLGEGLPPRAVEALILDPHDPHRLYAGTNGGGLWQGDRRGGPWTRLDWVNTAILGVVADGADPERIFVRLAYERLYEGQPDDSGNFVWQARWEGMSTVTEVMAFAQSPHNADILFAGGATDLYRSQDRARTWQRIGAELDGQSVFFLAVDEDDGDVVYAGATNDLYISRDQGDSWQRWGTGLADRTVTSVARHPRMEQILYAGTKYAGIFRSEDGGATWQLDFAPHATDPLSVEALHFSPTGDHLYAATNRGLLAKRIAGTDAHNAQSPLTSAPLSAAPTVSPDQPAAPRYGMHTISANPDMLPLVYEAGFDTVVKLFTWWEIEPTRGQFIWQPWDEVVAGAEYYGLNLVIRLDKHPDWSMPGAADPDDKLMPVDLAEYERFVRAVAERYQGRVAGYILWNEPNLALEWSGLPPDPEGYVALLRTGYAAVKAADPAATVISAGLAPTNTNNEEALDDRLFVDAMYSHGAAAYFDVMAAHPYGFGRPPDDAPGANNGLNMARLEDLRAIMERHGDGDKPVWITEMGWTLPGYTHAIGKGVTLQQQARYWVDALEKIRRDWPWVGLVTAWNLGGQGHPDWGGYSLLGRGGEPRPVYRALQRAVLAKTGPTELPARGQPSQVTVLAADAVVHLGDAPHLGQPWFPIYRARPISPEWEGIVYLQEPGDEPWQLTLRVMQSNFWSNLIWINGEALLLAIPPDDFSRSWVAYTVSVPAEMLRPGPNQFRVTIAQSAPLIQAQNFAYDEVQIKEIILNRTGRN